MSLTGDVLKPLAISVLIPLGLTTAAASTDAAIHKKMFGSGARPADIAKQTTSTISNEEMNDIIEIIKSLEESSLLMKSVSKTNK